MSDKELFAEVITRLASKGVKMVGTLVYVNANTPNEKCVFNSEGYSFAFNIMRLGCELKNNVNFI